MQPLATHIYRASLQPLAFAMLAGASGTAHAAEWLMTPTASVLSDYTDNPRLLADAGESYAGAISEVSTKLRMSGERWRLSAVPRARFSRYASGSVLDSDDQFLDATLDNATERGSWSLTTSYSRDTTLTSELDTTGFVQTNRRHEGLSLTGSSSWMLTERTSLGGNLFWQDSHYADAASAGLTDYSYRAATAFANFMLTEASELRVSGQSGELLIPGSDDPTRDTSVRLTLSYSPAPLWSMSASAGPSFVSTRERDDEGRLYSLEATRRGERWRWTATLGRDVTPTGRGVFTRRDQLSVSTTYSMRQFLSTTLTLRGIENEDVFVNFGAARREVRYGLVEGRINWRCAEQWSLSLLVAAATQQYGAETPWADNFRAQLGMVWTGRAQQL